MRNRCTDVFISWRYLEVAFFPLPRSRTGNPYCWKVCYWLLMCVLLQKSLRAVTLEVWSWYLRGEEVEEYLPALAVSVFSYVEVYCV